MKIYTKTGDNGTTGLFAGPRVPKDHPRIQSYGTVDELNATIGVVVATFRDEKEAMLPADTTQLCLEEMMKTIQSDLFSIGAQLATPDPQAHDMCILSEARVEELEQCIDQLEAELVPLSNFIIPGGSKTSAMLHLSRTICRRAERDIVSLAHEADDRHCELLIVYLNRLSDLLFQLARVANARAGIEDPAWERPAT